MLVPASKILAELRAQVVPQEPAARACRKSLPQEPKLPAQATPPDECQASCAQHWPVRLSGAKLLKRVFEIDMGHCPNYGGEPQIIAAILEAPVI